MTANENVHRTGLAGQPVDGRRQRVASVFDTACRRRYGFAALSPMKNFVNALGCLRAQRIDRRPVAMVDEKF
jgi:hypothetical protein